MLIVMGEQVSQSINVSHSTIGSSFFFKNLLNQEQLPPLLHINHIKSSELDLKGCVCATEKQLCFD